MNIISLAICKVDQAHKPICESNKDWFRVFDDVPKYKLKSDEVSFDHFEGSYKLTILNKDRHQMYVLMDRNYMLSVSDQITIFDTIW